MVGFTVMEALVCPPGVHANVPPLIEGVAVNVELAPSHIVEELTARVGCGLTVIALTAEAVQPASV